MMRWECQKCGHIHNGVRPPEQCPDCNAPREQFIQLDHEPEGTVYVAEEHIERHVKRWECDVCGRVILGDEPPETCPNCGSTKDHFHIMDGEPQG